MKQKLFKKCPITSSESGIFCCKCYFCINRTKITNNKRIIPLEKLEKRVEELEQQVKELTDLLNNKEYSEPSTDLGFIVCDLEK